ncbi:MAG: hypothetical protein ACREFZ_02505, partial [Acetobacteraceae bacterium]
IRFPTFPARSRGAIFVKGILNAGAAPTAAQYVTFAHAFQIGQLPRGSGLAADLGAGSVACQVDVKTAYADGSAAHGVISMLVPRVAARAIALVQFSPARPPGGAARSLADALRTATLSLVIAPSVLPDWRPGEAVVVGNANGTRSSLIEPRRGNAGGYLFQCTTAGTTGTLAPPAWPQSVGTTVSDGKARWTNAGANVPAATHDLTVVANNAASDPWLSGPLAVQGRASALLFRSLRVVVDATAYADGGLLFDIMLANDIASVIARGRTRTGTGVLAYSATITLNGRRAFSSQPLIHNLYENWTWQVGTVPHVVNSSQDATLQIIHDPNDFIAAQAVQAYDTGLGVSPKSLGFAHKITTAADFAQPLTNPDQLVAWYMGGVGGRPDIGIDDIFVVWWFVTQNLTFQRVAMECAKVGGGIPWHYFNPATGRVWTTDDAPALWVYAPSYEPASAWAGGMKLFEAATGDRAWELDPAHFPELVYLQYLTTGRRYFLDELNAVTSWVVLCTPQSAPYRNYGFGLIFRGQQVRGSAWALRNINYAVYANPDGSHLKSYFRRMLDNNLYWFLGQIRRWQRIQGPELYGYFPTHSYGAGIANWEECYLLSSLAFSALLGHPAALPICQWMAHYFSGLLLNGSNHPISGLPPAQATTYDLYMFALPKGANGNTGSAYSWGSIYPPLQTWDAMQAEIDLPEAPDSCVQGGRIVWAAGKGSGGSYGDYSQLMFIGLTCLANLGIASAARARTVLTTQKASNGTHPPTLDDVSWAASGVTWRVVERAWNDSRILPHAAAPAAAGVYSSVSTPPVAAAGSFGVAAPVHPVGVRAR